MLTFSFFMADAYVTYLLVTERDAADLGGARRALTASALLWTAGSWIQERLVARDGPRRLVAGGFAGVAAGGRPVAGHHLGIGARRCWPWWPGGSAGLGIGMAYSPLSVTALAEAEPGQEGTATAALQLSDVLGVTLGTGLGGVIIAHAAHAGRAGAGALVGVFAVALAVSLVGLALSHRLPRRLVHDGMARR